MEKGRKKKRKEGKKEKGGKRMKIDVDEIVTNYIQYIMLESRSRYILVLYHIFEFKVNKNFLSLNRKKLNQNYNETNVN